MIIDYNQVVGRLLKPTSAYAIEKSHTDNILSDIPHSLKFIYSSRNSGNNFIYDDIEIMGMSKQIFDLFVSKHTLLKMLDNPLLAEDFVEKINEQLETIETKVYDLENKIENKKFITEKTDCYLWVYNNKKFVGVYLGVPQELMDTVLNKHQSFTCSCCGKKTTSDNFPDMYYDTKTLDCFCKKCHYDLPKNNTLKHLGD